MNEIAIREPRTTRYLAPRDLPDNFKLSPCITVRMSRKLHEALMFYAADKKLTMTDALNAIVKEGLEQWAKRRAP